MLCRDALHGSDLRLSRRLSHEIPLLLSLAPSVAIAMNFDTLKLRPVPLTVGGACQRRLNGFQGVSAFLRECGKKNHEDGEGGTSLLFHL